MAIVTYTSERHGFGLVYEGARLTHVDQPGDPRMTAAWRSRIPTAIAGGVLFLPPEASPADVAAGRVPSQFITTDDAPLPARTLSTWDWDDATRLQSAPFLERTGVKVLEATAVFWRGFPVLQLSAVPAAEGDGPRKELPAAPIEVLGMLYTPQQTFSSLLVMPLSAVEEWGERFQELMDGFFLLPLGREGRMRIGHQFVRSLHVEAPGLHDDLAPR
jgi:hypothetical protein